MILFLLAGLVISCAPSKNEEVSSGTYELLLEDSIRISYFGSLTLKDYHPQTDRYLALNEQEREVLIFDGTGSIIHAFNLQNDGPDAITGYGLNPTFANGNLLIFADRIYTGLRGKGFKPNGNPLPLLLDHFITFCSKGVSPETKAAYDVSNSDERLKLVYSFPMEFGVF